MTSVLPLDIVESENEFDIPCHFEDERTGKCDQPADYAVWTAHSRDGRCGDTSYCCTGHKEGFTAAWERFLSLGPMTRFPHRACGQPVAPHLSDNLRFIPL